MFKSDNMDEMQAEIARLELVVLLRNKRIKELEKQVSDAGWEREGEAARIRAYYGWK